MLLRKAFPAATRSRLPGTVIFVAVLVGLVLVMSALWPIGPDYYFTYRPVAEKLVHGDTRLYDAASRGFFNAPWTVLFLVPLTWFSLSTGQAMLTVSTLATLLLAVHLIRADEPFPRLGLALALVNLHTFDLLIRGQVDHLLVVGVALGWWAIHRHSAWGLALALWLIATKPINAVLVVLVYLITIRRWPLTDQARALTLTLFSALASCALLGFDLPWRYFDNYRTVPPIEEYLTLTLWRVAHTYALPDGPLIVSAAILVALALWLAWRTSLNRWTLSIALATNLVITPYAVGNHYAMLIPVMLFLSSANPRAALLAYSLTFTPLLRLFLGFSIAPIDMLYPATLLGLSWAVAWREGLVRAAWRGQAMPQRPVRQAGSASAGAANAADRG